jgi:hypothetical protein
MRAPLPIVELRFPHSWQAEALDARPVILPARHFVYPRQADEVERGALEVLIRPGSPGLALEIPESDADRRSAQTEQPFLATCALGFRDPAAPTGLWSTPRPEEICAVAGGYAYLIDTTAPERFTMVPYRPVLAVRAVVEANLLLFVGHVSILAWGRNGWAWETEKLSDEGVTVLGVEDGVLRGTGWAMRTDEESTFRLDLADGKKIL